MVLDTKRHKFNESIVSCSCIFLGISSADNKNINTELQINMSCSGPVSIGAVEYLGCIFMTVMIHF